MNIKDLKKYMSKPTMYVKGNATMWSDPYISKHLLKAHLDQSSDAASRSFKDIDRTVEWLSSLLKNNDLDILDLGCGPGLYTYRFAKKGYQVTGIDISKSSIDYAMEKAKEDQLSIKYHLSDYLSFEFKEKYDLVYVIYCDFAVLSFSERRILVSKIFQALKPGGFFVFDAYNKNHLDQKTFNKDFDFQEHGFWTDAAALCLNQSFHYEESQVFLDQHIILTDDQDPKVYRFYNQCMGIKDVNQYFIPFGFSNVQQHHNIVEDLTVDFYSMQKK